jgi:hypothetical protein
MSLRQRVRRWLRRRSGRPVVMGLPGTGKSTLVGAWPAAREATTAPGRRTPVVYLVDARALCGCLAWVRGRTLEQARQDIAVLPSRRVVVAVTHADEDCRIPLLSNEIDLTLAPGDGLYRALVAQELVRRNVLGGRRCPVVAGTLRDDASTHALIAAITAELNR